MRDSAFAYSGCVERGAVATDRYPLGSTALQSLMTGVARVGTLLHVLRHVTTRLANGYGMVAYNLAMSMRGFLDAHEVLGVGE